MKELKFYPEGTPFTGSIGRTAATSQPRGRCRLARSAGRTERARVPARRRRLRAARLLRLRHPHADLRSPRRGRLALPRLPHDGDLLADARVPADRPQPSLQRRRHHPGDGDRLSRATTAWCPRENGFLSEMLLAQGYATFAHRQVASDAGQRIRVGRIEGALAAVARLRALLRLPRRQDEPVGRRRWCTTTTTSIRRDGRRRAITSTPTSPTARSSTSPTCAPWRRTSRSSCTTASARDTRRITSSRSGSRSYRGRFDHGWDRWREEVFARQLEMGIVPPDTKLSPRPQWVKAWDTLSADARRLYARQMEVYAAFLEQTDHHIGRVHRLPRAAWASSTTRIVMLALGQRRVGRGRRARLVQREPVRQPRRADRSRRTSQHLDDWGGVDRFPTTRGAGRGRATRRCGAGSATCTRAA